MTKLLFTIHGNPGFPEDFDQLKQAFVGWQLEVMTYKPENDVRAILDDMHHRSHAQEYCQRAIVAYSWGGYIACRFMQEVNQNFDHVILINPTLTVESKISRIMATLLQVPVLGHYLIAKKTPSIAEDFLRKTFHPLTADQQGYPFSNRLKVPSLWQRALIHKLQQQELPLQGNRKLKVNRLTAIYGESDISVNRQPQDQCLQSVLNGKTEVTVKEIKGAGHSLLWTHNQEMQDIIGRCLQEPQSISQPQVNEKKHPHAHVDHNVISYLEQHLHRFPDRIALRWATDSTVTEDKISLEQPFTHDEVSYRTFAATIESLAANLADLGIQKGDRVVIFLPMSQAMYAAMFAVQRLGAIAVFLDSWARSHHLGATAECVQPKAMISHQAAFDLVADIDEFSEMSLKILAGPGPDDFPLRLENLMSQEGHHPIVPVKPDDTALITFTTGSSGKPKGANRTHRFLTAQHEALSEIIPYHAEDLDMPAFPIFSLNNLASGVTTILPAINLAAPTDDDSAVLTNQLLHETVSCTTLSPSMLTGVSTFCRKNRLLLESLRRVVTGGAPISRDNVRDFKAIAPNAEIWVLYGSTEVEPMAHIEANEMLALPTNTDPEVLEEGVNVGHIDSNLMYKFIKISRGPVALGSKTWQEFEVAPGQVGEFIVCGDHVCKDYYNNEEAFQRAKIVDHDGRIWHRTGDLGRLDSHGYLWIVGRIHNVIERGGDYYFPVRPEVILKRIDGVKHGAFLGIPDEKLKQRNAVAIQLDNEIADQEQVKSEIHRQFAKNNTPIDDLYVVEQIPMDPRHHSKVEYDILREQLLNVNQ